MVEDVDGVPKKRTRPRNDGGTSREDPSTESRTVRSSVFGGHDGIPRDLSVGIP